MLNVLILVLLSVNLSMYFPLVSEEISKMSPELTELNLFTDMPIASMISISPLLSVAIVILSLVGLG